MGSGASCTGQNVLIEESLSSEQCTLLKNSVETINKINNGAVKIGALAFKGLFIKAPETFPMFEFLEEDWEHSKHFEHHCSVVMRTIFHVINILDDKEKFERNMNAMGMRHAMLHMPQRHFDILGTELLHGLGVVLQESFTPELKQAWGALYELLSARLQNSMLKYNKDIGFQIAPETKAPDS